MNENEKLDPFEFFPLLCPKPECNRLIFSASVWSGPEPQCEGLACPHCGTFIGQDAFYAQHFYALHHQDEQEGETKKYLAFDLEIARNFDEVRFDEFEPNDDERIEILLGEDWIEDIYKDHNLVLCSDEAIRSALFWRPTDNKDWKRFRPLGITCAAAAASDGGLWNWWARDRFSRFSPQMTRAKASALVKILTMLIKEKQYTILTWNGFGFDFDVLAEESGMFNECKKLALNHIDMMFHFFASNGFPLGLDAAAKGMGLPGKPEGMTGAIAPQLWANGEYHRVLDYVSWDGKNTLALAQAVDVAGRLDWTARSGRPNSWPCDRWLTVKESLELPEPDTSWMTDPWTREKFYGWTGYE